MESVNPIASFDPDFLINEFFNKLPIRIVGSADCPMFYAEDIAAILQIKRFDAIVRNFDELEIITAVQRKKHSIVTYRDNGKANNRILLTLGGAIRMISNTQNELSYNLRTWLYTIVAKISHEEKVKIQTVNETLLRQQDQLMTTIQQLKQAQDNFCNRNEQLYIFEITSDRYSIDDNGLNSDDEDSADAMLKMRFDDTNTIDDIEAYEAAVKKYPALRIPDVLYKITINPSASDISSYSPVFKTYCIDAKSTFVNVKRALLGDAVDCKNGDIFECSLEKIKKIISINRLSVVN